MGQSFYKLQGCGNDFIIIDNRRAHVDLSQMPLWARTLCQRKINVGADGLIFLDVSPDQGDYMWHFYNADGSRGEMCGNGSRCAGFLAYSIGLADAEHSFKTDVGLVQVAVKPENLTKAQVRVQLTSPVDHREPVSLELLGTNYDVHFVNAGVPHAVIIVPDARAVDVFALGRELRYHSHFSPAGTNVNIVSIKDRNSIIARTYERGVEAETLACGTGASASVYIAYKLRLLESSAHVESSGGEILGVDVENHVGNEILFLTGAATFVYSAELPKDFELSN